MDFYILPTFRCVIEEEKRRTVDPTCENEDIQDQTRILASRLTNFLNFCGLTDPDKQVYVSDLGSDGKSGQAPRLPELAFLVVIATLTKLQMSSSLGTTLHFRSLGRNCCKDFVSLTLCA